MVRILIVLVLFASLFLLSSNKPLDARRHAITGQINYVASTTPLQQNEQVVISLHKLAVVEKKPKLLDYADIYFSKFEVQHQVLFLRLNETDPSHYFVNYEFSNITSGFYSITAFLDVNKSSKLDLSAHVPLGFYSNVIGAGIPSAVELTQDEGQVISNANFELRSTTPFRYAKEGEATLKKVKGLSVLQLPADAQKRGYAHGLLTASQIIDVFRFYVLEAVLGSAQRYLKHIVPFIEEQLHFDDEFEEEAKAMLQGMQKTLSPRELYMPELKRQFSVVEIKAINSYIEIDYVSNNVVPKEEEGKTINEASRAACSQFAMWATLTELDPKLNGQIVVGRNMDGEIDLRKMTNSHLLVFAVKQDAPKVDYISIMWPGFIGTLTSINREGVYAMMNTGYSPKNPLIEKATPVNVVLRNVINRATTKDAVDPTRIHSLIEAQRSKQGGSCSTGCVLFFATAQQQVNQSQAYVYEGDYKGGHIRRAGEAKTLESTNAIMATNHFHVYGVNQETDPEGTLNFGLPVYFDTLSRYDRAVNRLNSWIRNKVISNNATSQILDLLQIVASGETEHSVIFRPTTTSGMEIDIFVADMELGLWDAPYLKSVTLNFEEFF